mmetsp:Transcript_14995/g.17002  ORF Transcript_14995/g.17002 Transcript_14995/m.17002 type:complete len:96 (+) Transcript_14995:50-337(+)
MSDPIAELAARKSCFHLYSVIKQLHTRIFFEISKLSLKFTKSIRLVLVVLSCLVMEKWKIYCTFFLNLKERISCLKESNTKYFALPMSKRQKLNS